MFARYARLTLALRAALVIAWQLAGWWIVVSCVSKAPAAPAKGPVAWS
ncbi:MAG: hypothetical protein NTX16_15155 [Actinobacteria bacterium]|nr:hypothetical protein [Actinomycetota bacterium]